MKKFSSRGSYIDTGTFKLDSRGLHVINGDLEVDGTITIKKRNFSSRIFFSIPKGLIFPFFFRLSSPLTSGYYNWTLNGQSVKVYIKRKTNNLYDIITFNNNFTDIENTYNDRTYTESRDGENNLIISFEERRVTPSIPLGWEIVEDLKDKMIFYGTTSSMGGNETVEINKPIYQDITIHVKTLKHIYITGLLKIIMDTTMV